MADLASSRVFGNLKVTGVLNGDGSGLTGTASLRATGTTASDVGLGSVDNYSRAHYDGRYLAAGGKAADSDKLDGLNSSQFLRSDTNDSASGTVSFTKDGEAVKLVGSGVNSNVHMIIGGSPDYQWRLGYDGASTGTGGNSVYLTSNHKTGIRLRHNGAFEYLDTAGSAKTVWHSGNFNPSSKLGATAKAADSDKLDGKDASAFADAAHKHPWSEVTGKPATATRWPTWSEVTSKPLVVQLSRTISTGSGLSGGGNLSDNRTLSVDSTVARRNSRNKISAPSSTSEPIINVEATTNAGSGSVLYGGSVASNTTDRYFLRFLGTSDSENFSVTTSGNVTSAGSITASGNITAFSDVHVKENIEVIPDAIDKLSRISGYTFDRTDIETERQTGVIAQEVLKVLPEAVTGGPTEDDPDGHYSVAYGNMVGLLIEALKEEKSKRESLENRLEKLEALLGEQN